MAADNLGPAAVSTTTKYSAPNPSSSHGPSLLLLGAAGVGAFLLMRRGSATTSAASSGTVTTTAGGSSYSPALGVPGAPVELQQVGGTATSVTVECAEVTGATQYNWYQYGTNLLLGTSPSNVAVIQGLQTNTGYEVYCTAVNVDGQQSPPSQPLLVTTGAGSPVVYVNNYGGSAGSGSSTTPPTTSTTPTAPTLPTGQTLALAADPSAGKVGQTETVTASSTALATYLSQLAQAGSGAPTVSWQWIIRSPSGSVTANQTLTNAAAQSQNTWTPNSAGQWALSVTCSVGGQTVGQGSLGVQIAGVTTTQPVYVVPSNPTNPSDYPTVEPNQSLTPNNDQNPIYKLTSGDLHIGAEVGSQARAQAIARALAVHQGVSLPGLSPAQAGYVTSVVAHHGNAVSGVLPNGVVQLSSTASSAEKVSLLASGAPVSIPGRSAAYVAYLQNLAKHGQLKGVTASGTAIT